MRVQKPFMPTLGTVAVPSARGRPWSPPWSAGRPIPVTAHLVALTLGVLLPVLILAAVVAVRYAASERRELELQAQAPVTDIAHTLGAEIKALKTAVLALANSEKLFKGDLAGFYERARRGPLPHGGWVVLKDPDGRQLINTLKSYGAELPKDPAPASSDEAVLATPRGEVHVSGIYEGRLAGAWLFTVGTPVYRDGRPAYIVKIAVPAKFLHDMLVEAGPPANGFTAIVDRDGRVMARTRAHEASVGRTASENFRRTVFAPDAPLRGHYANRANLENQSIQGFYERLPETGWVVSGAIDEDAFDAPLRKGMWLVAGAGAALLALSLTMALVMGRIIRRAIRSLVDQAEALGRGEAIEAVAGPIAEIDQVSGALAGAQRRIESKRRQMKTLLHELNHRVKNSMATLQSLARHSYRPGETGDRFYERFEGRLHALAKTHDLLVQTKWDGARLQDIASHELGAYGEQVTVAGEDVFLDARTALSLAMMLHELATNAAKYGSLSRRDGKVALGWDAAGGELRLEWRESGGPPVVAPEKRGFGTRLIEGGARKELGGTVAFDYRPDGLVCRLAVPLVSGPAFAEFGF